MQPTSKDVHNLISKIWPSKLKRGYCWLKVKFGSTDLEYASTLKLHKMYNCLTAKYLGEECAIHERRHKHEKHN